MAMYHLRVKFVQRSKGMSSVAGAAYRSGERMKDERTGRVSDYTKRTGVDYSEVMLPAHVPDELKSRTILWNTVEQRLTAWNAQPAFEVEVALPRELPPDERLELVRGFAQREFVDKGLIVDLCIHMGKASDGGEHPHAHMLITTRRWGDDGRMAKVARDLQDSPKLLQKVYALEEVGKLEEALLTSKGTNLAGWRERWANDQNDFLERGLHADRVDHRTLAAQKIAREPMPNIGFAFHRELDGLKGWLRDRVDAFKAFSRMDGLREQFGRLQARRRDLTAEFVAMAREHAHELVKDFGFDDRGKGAGREASRSFQAYSR